MTAEKLVEQNMALPIITVLVLAAFILIVTRPDKVEGFTVWLKSRFH